MLPYWLRDALMPLPALLVMLVGVGLPWALVMLPRRDWRSRPLVVMVLLAAGPALVTGWMLVLGMVGGRTQTPALTWPTVAAGVAALSIGGWALMLHKRRTTQPHPPLPRKPLAFDERLLLLLMGVAVVIRFVSAVWYPFWEYDPLWVYAYQGKLYPLLGYIPQDIGYYPQLVPLSYAYAQLAVGQINDHVARAMFPVFQWGAGFAAYALGAQLFSRRVGIYLAALWVLYPHVAEWSIVGDLEIPLTFGFTGGAVFLLRAWFRDERRARLHDAALAGFFLGVTMWTKPTGGAFILGVGVLAAVELVRVRLNWRAVLPRLEITIVAGLACIPLGAVWYARNVLLGHPAIDFPHPFWPTQAQRSGVEFGWPLLALGVLLAALYTARLRARPSRRGVLVGVGLVLLGLVPSIVWPHRMTLPEWLALGAGVGVLAAVLLPYLRDHATEEVKRDARRLGWAALLALPYFVVWFMSYSYHYRLSFAIVPLMAAPVAVVLARWLPAQHAKPVGWLTGALLLASLPAVVSPLYHFELGWGFWGSSAQPDSHARLYSTNPALTQTVDRLREDITARGLENPVIMAPGLQRLPFFFPLDDVRNTETPVSLDQLRGVDYYVYTQEARWLYEENDLPEDNPVTGAVGRPEVMVPLGCARDSSFYGCVYRVRPERRRMRPPNALQALENVPTWGGFAQLAGFLPPSQTVLNGEDGAAKLRLVFHALGSADLEYTLYIHLIDEAGNYVTGWDSFPVQSEYTHYSTRFWQAGEYISHGVTLSLPPDLTLDPAQTYRLRVGMYDWFANVARLPVQFADGTTDDGVVLPLVFTAR